MTMNAAAPPGLVSRNRLTDWADKYLFILIFLIGVFLIVFLKRVGVSQFLVTAAPVAAMLVYGFYIFATPRYRLREDRAGDSLYYLGFLYTMVSLAYSLYEFRGGEGGAPSIVTNFGIALATTIMGLMLRVVYHQLRQDPFEVERQVHMELTDAAEKLRGELLAAVTSFNLLRTAIAQSLSEAEEETTKAVENMTKKCMERYLRSSTDLTNAVSESAANVRAHTAALVGMLEECRNNYVSNASELGDAVRGTVGKLDKVSSLIEERAAQIVSAFERMVKRVDEVEVPPDMLKSKVQHIVEQLDTAVQSALKRIQAEQDRISGLEKLIEQTTSLTTKLTADINVLQTEALTQREAIRLAMTNLKESVDSVSSAASSVVAVANKNVEDHRALLQALEKESGAALGAVRDHREKITSNVKASTEMLSQVHSSLVSLTRTIVEKLDGKRN